MNYDKNRNLYFMEKQLYTRTKACSIPVTVSYLILIHEIDNFDTVNDSYFLYTRPIACSFTGCHSLPEHSFIHDVDNIDVSI